MSKHTQGTWYYDPDLSAVVAVVGHKVKVIADFGKVDLPECEANAKLIESAPKLLAALERCVRYGGLFPDLAAEAAAVITEVTGG